MQKGPTSGSGEYGGQCHDVVFAIKYASYIDRIGQQKTYKNHGKTFSFFVFWGAWRGLVTPKACPGMVLGDRGAPFGIRRTIFDEFLRRLARRWAQDGRSWNQVGSTLRPRWAKIAPSWRSWAQLARFWEHVGSILAHGLDGRKATKT